MSSVCFLRLELHCTVTKMSLNKVFIQWLNLCLSIYLSCHVFVWQVAMKATLDEKDR